MSDQPRDENGRFARSTGDVPVLYHLERIIQEHQRGHEQRHKSDQEALRLGREDIAKQLAALRTELKGELVTLRQEFRGDRAEFVTKTEAAAKQEAHDAKDVALVADFDQYKKDQTKAQDDREEKAATQKRANTLWLIGLAVSIAGLALALFVR